MTNKFFTIEKVDGTDKFTVATQTGNTHVYGTLDVEGEAKFQDNIMLSRLDIKKMKWNESSWDGKMLYIEPLVEYKPISFN